MTTAEFKVNSHIHASIQTSENSNRHLPTEFGSLNFRVSATLSECIVVIHTQNEMHSSSEGNVYVYMHNTRTIAVRVSRGHGLTIAHTHIYLQLAQHTAKRLQFWIGVGEEVQNERRNHILSDKCK